MVFPVEGRDGDRGDMGWCLFGLERRSRIDVIFNIDLSEHTKEEHGFGRIEKCNRILIKEVKNESLVVDTELPQSLDKSM